MKWFEVFGRRVSKNGTKQCFVLKCNIRKFFASIDHQVLLRILEKYIIDLDLLYLFKTIIESHRPGLPLGNLASQLLVNIYMNEFDQFMKHVFKVPYYIRYADDFVIFSHNKEDLRILLMKTRIFLKLNLNLELHPNKVSIQTLGSGVDFLGWVHFPDHRVLRTVAKRRVLKKVNPRNVASYLGMLQWGNGWKLKQRISHMLDR